MEPLLQAAQPALAVAGQIMGSPVTWLEIAAFGVSVAMVVANMRVNPVGWPLAIVASLMYGLLFADAKLYGEAGLQLVFVAVAFWGWWQWLRGHDANGQPLRVSRLSARAGALALAAVFAGWPLLALLLARATDSDVPWFDALPTVGSIVGQVLLARKHVENWAVWFCVNLVSVALFAHKGLWLTVILYALFALLSVAGWRAWQRLASHAGAAPG
jgi:nicotinamide mononucleotide transporter